MRFITRSKISRLVADANSVVVAFVRCGYFKNHPASTILLLQAWGLTAFCARGNFFCGHLFCLENFRSPLQRAIFLCHQYIQLFCVWRFSIEIGIIHFFIISFCFLEIQLQVQENQLFTNIEKFAIRRYLDLCNLGWRNGMVSEHWRLLLANTAGNCCKF